MSFIDDLRADRAKPKPNLTQEILYQWILKDYVYYDIKSKIREQAKNQPQTRLQGA